MRKNNFQQSNLQGRAKRNARVIAALFARQNLSGSLKSAHRGARHLTLGIRLNDATMLKQALQLAEPLALASGSEAVLAQRIGPLVTYQFQLASGFWEFYTRADLPDSQSVGLAEQRKPVKFSLDPPHVLVGGTTGSGKTETLRTILLSLVTSHTPSQLSLILVDPNRDHDDFENVAHLALPIARDAEAIAKALSYGNQLLVERIENNIKDDKIAVIALDEGESVLSDKTNLACAVSMARQGRKYGIHLMVSTQKPNHTDLPDLLDKMLNRYVGLLSDASLSARLTGHPQLGAHRLTGKGDFLRVNGPECSRFQVALCRQTDFNDLLRSEIKPIAMESNNIVVLPELPEEKAIGRPSLIVDPKICASYFWSNPQNISISMAKSSFGLGRTGHDLHKSFTLQFISKLKELRSK